jgi:hypothetical protein
MNFQKYYSFFLQERLWWELLDKYFRRRLSESIIKTKKGKIDEYCWYKASMKSLEVN